MSALLLHVGGKIDNGLSPKGPPNEDGKRFDSNGRKRLKGPDISDLPVIALLIGAMRLTAEVALEAAVAALIVSIRVRWRKGKGSE